MNLNYSPWKIRFSSSSSPSLSLWGDQQTAPFLIDLLFVFCFSRTLQYVIKFRSTETKLLEICVTFISAILLPRSFFGEFDLLPEME